MSRRFKVLTIAISVVVMLLLSIGGVALANDSEGKPFGPRMCKMGGGGPNGLLSEVLGLTPEEIKAKLQAGMTIADIAAEQGVSQEQLKDAMHAAMVENLQQKVADGTITQAQADQILQRIQDRLAENGPLGFGFKGHGRFCGMGVPCAPPE